MKYFNILFTGSYISSEIDYIVYMYDCVFCFCIAAPRKSVKSEPKVNDEKSLNDEKKDKKPFKEESTTPDTNSKK
jgi:wyosine [tRNA(Phe)-imidazoG37] synthetase (radical SAM superfamily)